MGSIAGSLHLEQGHDRVSAGTGKPTSTMPRMKPSSMLRQASPAPQRFVFNYVYQLPFGNPKGALGYLAKGWAISGVTMVQGGTPMTFFDTAGGTAYYGAANPNSAEGGSSTAQLAPGVTYGQIKDTGGIELHPIVTNGTFAGLQYFNPAAFTAPPVIGADGATLFR